MRSRILPSSKGPVGLETIQNKWPFTEAILRYDTKDHVHGVTGFVTKTSGDSRTDSTGLLPNSGSAGNDYDLDVEQTSEWFSGSPSVAVYQASAFFSKYAQPSPYDTIFTDAFGGSISEAGPLCFISILGDLETDPDLEYNGDVSIADRSYILFTNTFDFDVAFDFRHYLEIFTSADFKYLTDSSYNALCNSAGNYEVDLIPYLEMTSSVSTVASYANKALVTLMHQPGGLCDNWFNNRWHSIDSTFNLDDTVTHGWNGVSADRAGELGAGNDFPTESICDSYIDDSTMPGIAISIEQLLKYDVLPVEGEAWNTFRGISFHRGIPTEEDIANVIASFGA